MTDRLRRYNLVIGPIQDDPHDLTPEDRREMLEVDWRDVRIEWVPDAPTGEKKSARYCPQCKEKLNQHTPPRCPQCGADLLKLLWDENDRLREQRDFATWVENLTDTALRERIQRLATAAEHFWQQRDAWMTCGTVQHARATRLQRERDSWRQQGEAQTAYAVAASKTLLAENRLLREKIEQLTDELADSKLHQRGMVESVLLQEAEAEIEQLMPLAVAVGKCDPDDVPEPVYRAWNEPDTYRKNELVRLRDREAELETQVSRLTRQLDAADKTIVKNWSIDEENARLRAFRDAVYATIYETAGELGGNAFAYIWQSKWDEIKAAEKGTP